MNSEYKKFFRSFYMRTGGFIPAKPLGQNIYPGDFFQVRNGEMIILGNIFQKRLIEAEDAELSKVRLNPSNWNFSDGISKPYSGRGTGHHAIDGEFEFSKQIIAFKESGSFIFKGNEPESLKIANWNEMQQSLIIKLTQSVYSFRKLYLVTETASASDWTLAIAGSDKAELEIATDSENFGLVDIFGHHSAKTIQSKDIEYYYREDKRKPVFFKAKKLTVQEEKMNTFINELIEQRENINEWAIGFFNHGFHYDSAGTSHLYGNAQASMLDMLHANELNPGTALLYFKWADASLDDVEKLFLTYGN